MSLPRPIGDGAMPALGRYQLLLELGRGGMARVFLAVSSGMGGFHKLVVLKVMHEEGDENPQAVEMFLREARLAARLNHPNIVQTFEVGSEGERYFIGMEFLEGQTLGKLLSKTREQPLPLAQRVGIMCDVLEGLRYVHELADIDGTPLNLIHRDVSPYNVFVGYDGQVKLLDFGIAKVAGLETLTEIGTFKGKLSYAAPEQITDEADHRADLFAAGVLMWEMMASRRLTAGRTMAETTKRRLEGEEPALKEVQPDIPDELSDICSRAMKHDREERFASAREMLQATRAFAAKAGLRTERSALSRSVQELYIEERITLRRSIQQRLAQSQRANAVAVAEAPSLHPTMHDTGAMARSNLAYANTSTAGIQEHSASQSMVVAAPPSRAKWLFAGAGMLAVGAALGGMFTREGQAPSSAAPLPRVGGAAPPQASASAEPRIRVEISAKPRAATLILDGGKLPNPFKAGVEVDRVLHTLEVRLTGHITQKHVLSFERDAVLAVELLPEKTPPARAGSTGRARLESTGRVRAESSGPARPEGTRHARPETGSIQPPPLENPPPSASNTPRGSMLERKKPTQPSRPIDSEDPYR